MIEGGALWQFDENGLKKQRYFTPAEWESQPVLSPSEFTNRLNDTFAAALPRDVGSGEGVGISLTGGLDTRMIMSCLPDISTNRHATHILAMEGEPAMSAWPNVSQALAV